MRLLNTDNLEVEGFGDNEVPHYAILSHTWGEGEVTLQDMEGSRAANKKGYEKVRRCCSLAKANGFAYVGVDTCCIDKTSSAELSEAINSMYLWYQEAEVCYAYLADVPSKSKFQDSRWFTRGWTLQELISPSTVIFFDEEWKQLGTKADLQQDIFDCTGIPLSILTGDDNLEMFSIAQRMSWAAKRETSRIEDRAYCLLGIFGIHMPLIYGERETAFIRLQEEIMRFSDDHSLFAWKSSDSRGGLLATSPGAFVSSGNIVQFNPFDTFNSPLTVSSRGIYLELRFVGIGPRGLGLAILHCKERSEKDKPIAIHVRDLFLTMEQFERVQSEKFELFNQRTFKQSQYPMRRICILKGRMAFLQKSKSIGKRDSIAPKEIYPNDKLPNLMKFGSQTDFFLAARIGLTEAVWLLLTRNDIGTNLQDEHGQTALSHATRAGQEMVVKMLLGRNDIMVELRDYGRRTPLSWAAENGNEAIAQRLLDKGADIESKDKEGRTPLWWASENGHEAIVRLLLEKGADTELKEEDGRTRLSWAAARGQEGIVQLLLDRGAHFESRDTGDRTPLWWASENGHVAIVRLLLEKGADTELKDKDSRTRLSWAAARGQEGIIQLLLDYGADIESRDKGGRTSLWWASGEGHETVVQLLLEKSMSDIKSREQQGWKLLWWASKSGRVSIVLWLLNKGVDIESKDQNGRTPLSWAAIKGHEAVVRLLLERGASIESKDKDGRTPLSWASMKGHGAVVRRLLDEGVSDIESKDEDGRTSLSWASENGQEGVVRLLLERGADTESPDNNGRTPLSWASENGKEGVAQLLFEKGADIESVDSNGQTPLSLAIEKGNEAIVQLLLDMVAGIRSSDKEWPDVAVVH